MGLRSISQIKFDRKVENLVFRIGRREFDVGFGTGTMVEDVLNLDCMTL